MRRPYKVKTLQICRNSCSYYVGNHVRHVYYSGDELYIGLAGMDYCRWMDSFRNYNGVY